MKKIFLTFLSLFILSYNKVFSAWPDINCVWLPWCWDDWSLTNPSEATNENIWAQFIDVLISNFIQIVAVFAVFALIISWFMYIISWWDEDKAKKSKKWIIWSLVAVLLSVSAWWIINFINSVQIW